MAVMIFDRKTMIQALKKGEATPEQQRDAACLLLLLCQISSDNFDTAESLYLTLKASGMAGGHTQVPPTPIPTGGVIGYGGGPRLDASGDFGWALHCLHDGLRICRKGWDGKGMWLILVTENNWRVTAEFEDGEPHTLLPWIGMKTVYDTFAPWLASQTDMLAEDWQIAP